MLSLKENNKIIKAQMLLEEITFEDLKGISNVFKRIEDITAQHKLPEIERVLEIARDDLAILNSPDFKKAGLAGGLDKVLNIFGQSRAARGAREILGRLVAIQTTLVKLLRVLPNIMNLTSKAINVKKEWKEIVSEMSAIELSKRLNVGFQELQTRANELAGEKIITSPNDEVPEEVEAGIKQSISDKNPAAEKMMGNPADQKNSKLSNLLGRNASQRFIDYVIKTIKSNKAFVGKNIDAGKLPDPQRIAEDLLNLSLEEFQAFANQTQQNNDIQMGLSVQDAKQLSGATKKDNTTPNKTVNTPQRVLTNDLLTAWSKMFPGVRKDTLMKMVNGLAGKTIVAGQATKQTQQKIKS